jgi:excisionase family DNA binding protein
LNLYEVSAILGCCYRTAYDLAVKGKLRAMRLGRRWKVRRSDLHGFIDERHGS